VSPNTGRQRDVARPGLGQDCSNAKCSWDLRAPRVSLAGFGGSSPALLPTHGGCSGDVAPANAELLNRDQRGSCCPPGSRGGQTATGNCSVTWIPFSLFPFPNSHCPASLATRNGPSSPRPHEPFLWTWQSPARVSSSASCDIFLIVTGYIKHAFFLRIADLVKQSGQDCSCGCRSC